MDDNPLSTALTRAEEAVVRIDDVLADIAARSRKDAALRGEVKAVIAELDRLLAGQDVKPVVEDSGGEEE